MAGGRGGKTGASAPALLLEREGYPAADGPGGVDEVYSLAVVANNRDVSLGQEVANVDQGLHAATEAWNGLADKDVQVRVTLAGRRIEHVDRRQGCPIDPAVGSDPASMSPRSGSAQFRGQGMTPLG